jgi:hypothetical protein
LQRTHTLANQNVGIGARIGGKQLLQLEVFLRDQRIKLFFRQPLSRTFASSRATVVRLAFSARPAIQY